MADSQPLAGRCRRAANAAIAPKTCNVSVRTNPFSVTIGDEAPHVLTPAERAAAKAAAEGENPAPRQRKALATLVAEIETWIGNDAGRLRKVAAIGLATELLTNPRLARQLNIPLDGDT